MAGAAGGGWVCTGTQRCYTGGVRAWSGALATALWVGLAAPVAAQEGWTEELTLANAPHEAPAGAPAAVVHAPPGFDPERPLRVVVFLHGWRGCARVLAYPGQVRCHPRDRQREGWDLIGRFDEARVNALFVIPQLAYLRRDGGAGRFLERGRFAAFLHEAIASLGRRLGDPPPLEAVTVLAHSAGYESALAVISRGGLDGSLRHVVLFDALYRGHGPFADWALASPERRLISLHTGQGRTASQSRMLVQRVRAREGDEAVAVDPDGGLGAARVVVAETTVAHGDVPARHLAEVLRALGSPTIDPGS